MKKPTQIFYILMVYLILIGCKSNLTPSLENSEWRILQSEKLPFNIYGVDFELVLGTKMCFKENQMVKISHPEKSYSSIVNYKFVKDTLISYFDRNFKIKRELTNVIYFGKADNMMFEYRIKKINSDSLILISQYRKEILELPKPNEFDTKQDLFNDYQLFLIKEK